MDKKTKILTFAAVALMFAVCFIGFVAISDDAVDADGDNDQGNQIVNPGGTVTVEGVAKIGENKYPTLAVAVDKVESGQDQGVITLVADNVELDRILYVTKEIKIDLNGKTISKGEGWVNTTDQDKDALICVKRGGILTIDDTSDEKTGKIDSTGIPDDIGACIKLTGKGETDGDVAKLTVNGGTFLGKSYAICGNGTRHGTILEINDGTFEATNGENDKESTAIYLPQVGETKITGGTFTGHMSALEIRSGSLVIIKGNFTARANEFKCESNGDGVTTTGAAIAIAQHTTKKTIDIKITGGTFTGPRAINESNPQANTSPDVVVDIQGGTFNGMIAIMEKNKANVSVECAFTVESEGEKRWYFNDSEIISAVNWINEITSGNVTLEIFKDISITEAGTAQHAALWFTKGVTINGNDKVITYNATNGSGLNVLGFSENVTATVNNLIIDGNQNAFHGINIWKATKISLNDIIVKNVNATGINTNCAETTISSCDVSQNCLWGGVNVDIGSSGATTCKLTVTGDFKGNIWTETFNSPSVVDYNDAIVTATYNKDAKNWKFWYSPDYDFTPYMMLLPSGAKVVLNDDLTLPEGKKIVLNPGVELKILDGKKFSGLITSTDENSKLLANGLKAGEGGITITGGSLSIDGKIIDASGVENNVTVTVEGNEIYINGSLEPGAIIQINANTTVTIKDEESFVSKGAIINEGTIINNGTFTNEYKLIMAGDDAMINGKDIINNGVIIDKRNKGAEIVPIDTDSKGIIISKKNSKLYEDEGFEAVAQNPDIDVKPEGMIEVDINKFAFIDPITTTGKLDIVMNDGNRQYTITIPEGTMIALGTVITVKFIEHQSFATKYYINTPGIENFSVKLPCQIGFKKAKVLCDDSELGISEVRYNKGTGYVTFDAAHNSVFTIVLSEASPANVTTTSGGNATNDYSLVIAFVVLVASLGFLVYVIRKKQ